MKYITLLLTICIGLQTLYADNNSDATVVILSTETQRLPAYVTSLKGDTSNLPQAYLSKLLNVLSFDLDHNGMMYLLKSSPERDKLANGASPDSALNDSDWKTLKAYYVVKGKVDGDKLSIRLFSVNADQVKSIDSIQLTGDLSRDRRIIHQMADTIHRTLFGVEGIAATKILYTLKTKNGSKWDSEIWEADYDGENKRQITFDSGYAVTPTYVPPKPRYNTGSVFFVSYKTGQSKIHYVGLNDNSSPRRLNTLKGNQLMPTISRQRDKIAFISDITGNPDLFIQEFDPDQGPLGKPYQAFSTHLATQGTPSFSPDGERIAFVSNKDGSPRIYVIDVPTPGTALKDIKATLITKRNKESTAPAWSPDGSKIAFCSSTQGVRQIWIYDFITREERQLTQGPGNKENPTWAPNSLHLAFNSSDANASDLYVINLNQTDAVKISSGIGEKRFPSWEPR